MTLSKVHVSKKREKDLLIVMWQNFTEFDEGHLCSDPVAGQEEINKILAVMEDTEPPVQAEEDPMRYEFQTICDRLKKVNNNLYTHL